MEWRSVVCIKSSLRNYLFPYRVCDRQPLPSTSACSVDLHPWHRRFDKCFCDCEAQPHTYWSLSWHHRFWVRLLRISKLSWTSPYAQHSWRWRGDEGIDEKSQRHQGQRQRQRGLRHIWKNKRVERWQHSCIWEREKFKEWRSIGGKRIHLHNIHVKNFLKKIFDCLFCKFHRGFQTKLRLI